ncbi:MAG: amidohydrolase family protein [Peptococcaceae bacterium]
MIIDGHIHFGGYFNSCEKLLASMDAAGIAKGVIVPFMFARENFLKYYDLPPWVMSTRIVQKLIPQLLKSPLARKKYVLQPDHSAILQLRAKCPGRLWAFYWTNPNYPTDLAQLKNLIRQGNYAGIKLHQVIHPFRLRSREIEELLDITNNYRLPVFIHLDSPEDCKEILAIAGENPRTNFIIAHLDYHTYWLESKAELANVYYDISPVTEIKLQKIREVLKIRGSGRLVFGTDSPCAGGQGYAVEKLKSLDISPHDLANICYKNLLTLLNGVENCRISNEFLHENCKRKNNT